MGGHNRPYPSLRWVGMDDEQIFARDTRNQGLRVARLSHRRSIPILWPGPINGWRWSIWSIHRTSLGALRENCSDRPCINNPM